MSPDTIAALLQKDFGLHPVVGAELEFYAPGATESHIAAIEAALQLKIEKEKGRDQYEIALAYSPEPMLIVGQLSQLKELLAIQAKQVGLSVDFSARPYPDQFGSGIHFHLHLEDADGRNVFFRDGEDYSPDLLHAIGGCLDIMQASMVFFAPKPASYARFTEGSNGPLTVSWGPNNRTVAIRLPNAPMEHKRIEHRVAGSDADPAQALTAVLAGIHHGLKNKIHSGEAVHGDASLPMYARERLANNFEEAKKRFENSAVIKNYFT